MPTHSRLPSFILAALLVCVGGALVFSRLYNDVWTQRLANPDYQTQPALHTPKFSTGFFLPHTIQNDLVLKVSDSPIILNQTVIIPQGVTLTIEAGTKLFANEFAVLQVNGRLVASGTPVLPVQFATNELNEANQVWGGILFMPGSSGTLDNTKLMNGAPGISCLHNPAVVLKNVTSTETKYPFYDCPGA